MKEFQKTEFIILDVETTGLSPAYGDRVIEIAALKIRDLKVADRFYSLVDPQRPLSYGAFMVNGITSEMLKGAPRMEEVLPDFLNFCFAGHSCGSKNCLVGHNIRFDLNFLVNECALCRERWPEKFLALDTVRLARWLLPELRRYRLQAVAQALEIEMEQQHRAMADVELTMEVFRAFLEMAFRRDVSDLSGLLKSGGIRTMAVSRASALGGFERDTGDEIPLRRH